MKNRFTTLDLIAILPEIREKLIGTRVYQVYDIDSKTFIIRFSKPAADNVPEEHLKQVLILESGIRIHLTEYDWPKSAAPSGFTMKLRKHLKNKRLESVQQIGNDRIVDLQFGTGQFCNHIILELYSKGNIIITDEKYVILSLIRFYKDNKTDVNIAVREKYPVNKDSYIAEQTNMSRDRIVAILKESKENNFKKLFNPHFLFGPHLLEHSLLHFRDDINVNKFKVSLNDVDLLVQVFQYADSVVKELRDHMANGYIILKLETRPNCEENLLINDEFHPYLFKQYQNDETKLSEYETFNKAVDIFFSSMESQRIESKVVQMEKQAMKKLEAIKKDHESRLENLAKLQEVDNHKAALIEANIELVDKAISVLRSAIANKYSWEMVAEMVKDAQDNEDPIASKIHGLKLEKNQFSMLLDDPYDENEDSMLVDIDIDISAYANARKYYDHRKDAAKKEQKTLDHSEKVFKNVERKVKQQLKETTIKTTIVMSRKVLWFEKFFWFISSEGFLVIAGRDAQQNEMIVKRYLGKTDIYVHADIHGATSVVVKNHTETEIPPKTINEAANMAVCYSASWEAKVVSAAYWVQAHQVQKTAPTGQYLSVGSFMIRGKKNYIPLQNLILGFGILFRIDDESIERRRNEIAKPVVETNTDSPSIQSRKSDHEENKSQSPQLFPDTTVKYREIFVPEDDAVKNDENDYTIVNTGENVKKKVKILTQKNVQKKTVQQQKNAKKKDRQKKNMKTDPEQPEVRTEASEVAAVTTEAPNSSETNQTNGDLGNKNQDPNEEHDEDDDDGGDDDDNNNNKKDQEEEEEDEEEEEVAGGGGGGKSGLDTQRILDSLVAVTGPEDNLLYAVPVCGPYTAMQSYKYKVKLVPGTTRRGKASKTALMLFLKEKHGTDRERDLLKALKDQDIAKNMPAKVKIVARINK